MASSRSKDTSSKGSAKPWKSKCPSASAEPSTRTAASAPAGCASLIVPTITPAMAPTASNASDRRDPFDLPPLLLLQIQQHDDKQEQHDDRPGIDQHLHRRQEEGVQQDKQARPAK